MEFNNKRQHQKISGYATINDEFKFAWFRNAKVATRSIKQVIESNGPCRQSENPKTERIENYYRFAFVRNPWDRLVSCYFSKIFEQEKVGFREYWGLDFAGFVMAACQSDVAQVNKHLRLQSSLIPVDSLDYIGRFENLQNDFRHACRVVGLLKSDLPHRNASTHQHYSHYYSQSTRDAVAAAYSADIELFEYTFEQRS